MEYKEVKVKNIGDYSYKGFNELPVNAFNVNYDPIITITPNYEQLIDGISNDMNEQIVRYVTSFGYEVDWERLERALEYDRSSYIKGYNDAFTASKEATDLYKLYSGMSESMQEAVRKIMETTQIGGEING